MGGWMGRGSVAPRTPAARLRSCGKWWVGGVGGVAWEEGDQPTYRFPPADDSDLNTNEFLGLAEGEEEPLDLDFERSGWVGGEGEEGGGSFLYWVGGWVGGW